jgi:hypothetical protein
LILLCGKRIRSQFVSPWIKIGLTYEWKREPLFPNFPKASITGSKASSYYGEIQFFPFVLHSAHKCCFFWQIQTQIHVSNFFPITQHLEGFAAAKWCSWLKKGTRNLVRQWYLKVIFTANLYSNLPPS